MRLRFEVDRGASGARGVQADGLHAVSLRGLKNVRRAPITPSVACLQVLTFAGPRSDCQFVVASAATSMKWDASKLPVANVRIWPTAEV